MTGHNDDNKESSLDQAVQHFIDAQLRGQQPDLDEFVRHYPELEHQIRQKILNLQKIDTLFDSLTQADESDFEDTAAGRELVGRKIGGFEIVKVIGRGGMGVVYLAHDTKLDRSVAVKSIPAKLADDSTARMRFHREAKLLASLNHPNIAVIHEIIEQQEGAGYLVLEYVPGQTLAERIAHKPLKLEEALSIARQIALAVSAAHEKGVMHRDLKPGNIKLLPDGRVKVLDFGLAKAVDSESSEKPITVTQPGRVMGTPAYMSPEQARGKPTDKRSDIWSFGCIMYEMLTGHLPFEGETATDTLVCIIERQPDWELLPQDIPTNIRTLLRRCLEKNPLRRLRDIGDAAIEIDETLSSPTVSVATVEKMHPVGMRHLIAAIACLVVFAVAASLVTWSLTRPGPSPSQPLTRFVIHPITTIGEEALWHHALAVSPDGKYLAYVDEGEVGGRILYLRGLDDIRARQLPGTEGAISPFFSPDGEWIGFYDYARKELKKMAVAGGTPTTLCKPQSFGGGSWGPNNTIIFARELHGLRRYTASGEMEELTVPDPNKGELRHVSPQVLPGSDAVLFTNQREDGWRIEVLLLQTGERRVLLEEDARAVRYVPTGHLVFLRDKTLYAVPFDLEKLKVIGSAQPVLQGIRSSYVGTHFAFSENGTLLYLPAPPDKRSLVCVDRTGVVEPMGVPPRPYTTVRISPDGNHLALTIGDKDDRNIWILDKARLTHRQLTFDGQSKGGIWTQDGKRVIFDTCVGRDLYLPMWTLADGSGQVEPLAEVRQFPEKNSLWASESYCLSPDGNFLLGGRSNIWVLPMEGKGDPRPFITMDHFQRHPAFSPDGQWVAYDSTETGPAEVYVQPFPGPGGITKVSAEGGYGPLWSRDGDELFYRNADKMMFVTTETEPEFKAGVPQELFKGQFWGFAAGNSNTYDIAPDGRFLMIQEPGESTPLGINVVLNWFDQLKKLVPTGKGE